jgi:hypothetical protein
MGDIVLFAKGDYTSPRGGGTDMEAIVFEADKVILFG